MKKMFIKFLCCALILFSLSGVSVCAAEDDDEYPANAGGIFELPFGQE